MLCIWACSDANDADDGSGGSGGVVAGSAGTAGTRGGGQGGVPGDSAGAGGARAGSGAGSDAGDGGSQSSAGAGGSAGSAGSSSSSECGGAAGGGGGGAPLQCSALAGGCGSCIEEKCCDLFELCSVDADCACMAMCIGQQSLSGVDGCLDTCAVSGSPPRFADLADCVATTCPDGDECSAPSNFMPPPDAEPSGGGGASASIASGMLADCSFDAGLNYDPNGPILQLESADGSICVRIERRNDGAGSLANTQFTLLGMRVGPLGEVVAIDGTSDLCWYSSHHNFNDWAHAWSGSRHYDVKMARTDHGAAPTFTLHVFEEGPLAAGSCAPTTEGACSIGSAIELVAVNP